jgi:ATP/maltotriose-dependent transcriptional regulator MalT
VLEHVGALVGRRFELGVLQAALAGLDARGQGVIQIAGEQGIGKTRLLAEVCAEAERHRYLVFSGRAIEFDPGEAFGVFVDALDDYLASLDRRDLDDLVVEVGELAWVFPALARMVEHPGGTMPAERYRAHQAVRVLLDTLSRQRPVVLTLDDLHWADEASVELVSYLLRRPPRGRVLVVMAFRPTQLPKPFEAVLEASTRAPPVIRLDLDPLSSDEAHQLLDPDLPPAMRDELYRLSGGNPFYLESLARAATVGARVPPATGATVVAPVPVAVQRALTDELTALPDRAHALLQGAAVVGDPFDVGLAAAIGEVPAGDVLGALDELVAAAVIRPSAMPLRFGFRHPLVRHAVYESAPAGWRIGAHARAAATLATLGASAVARAHHVERSAHTGDVAAVTVLTEAGDASVGRAPATAALWYEAALRLMPETADERPHRLEVLMALAPALAAIGRLDDSRAALIDALDLVAPDDDTTRLDLVAQCANVELLLGRHRDADARLHRALADPPDPLSVDIAALHIVHSLASRYEGEFEAMRASAQDGYTAATACGQRALRACAAALLAHAQAEVPRAGSSDEVIGMAATLVDELTDEELATSIDTALIIGRTEIHVDRFDNATRHLERGLEVARATGQGQLLVPLMLGRVVLLCVQGRLPEASELVDSAVEAGRLSGLAQLLAWPLQTQCWVVTDRGDVEAAIDCGEEGLRLARELDQRWIHALAGATLGTTRLEAGDPETCRRHLLDAAGGPSLPFLSVQHRCWAYEVLTRADIARGCVEDAAGWAARAEATAIPARPRATAAALQARAAVRLATGDASGAAELALRAAETADSVGARIVAGRSRTLAGQAYAEAGQNKEAILALDRAEAELATCGAVRYADQAARELRRLGRRVIRTGRRGDDDGLGLSRRELEVARLVAGGKTNREIAAELFLSNRTVESHLSRVFAKLGVSSRAAVGAVLARHGE